MTRYDAFVAKLKIAITESDGFTTPEVRSAIVEGKTDGVPPAIASYVDTVQRNAYRVTDAEVEALKTQGMSEDEIFEVTASAALGAALYRLERGMDALKGKRA